MILNIDDLIVLCRLLDNKICELLEENPKLVDEMMQCPEITQEECDDLTNTMAKELNEYELLVKKVKQQMCKIVEGDI